MVIAKLYALGCICIKGELLSLPKVIFLLGNDKISGCLAFAKFVEISPDCIDGLDKSCTKHTRRADDDKHPKRDQGEMSEFGNYDKVKVLDQLRQMMDPD